MPEDAEPLPRLSPQQLEQVCDRLFNPEESDWAWAGAAGNALSSCENSKVATLSRVAPAIQRPARSREAIKTPSRVAATGNVSSETTNGRHAFSGRSIVLLLLGALLVGLAAFYPEATDGRPSVRGDAAPVHRYETRAIQDIREGDIVLARDEFGTDLAPKRVVETYERTSDHLRILEFRSLDGVTQTLKTTNEHPFWSVNQGRFVEAVDLEVGDQFSGPNGELQTLTSTEYEPHPEGITVYNFQVEDYHTYFVNENGARAPPMLVHNMCGSRGKVYRELSAYDRARLDAGKALQPKLGKGTIQRHVQGHPTKHISASDTIDGTSRFHSGNGLAEIDVDKVRQSGTKFIDHEEILDNLSDPDAIRDAITADEVLFEGPIPRSAIEIIDNF
jgi:hypothetical protein